MNYDNTLSEVKQLTGNTGSQNTSYNRPPGQLKAMKGSDFDKKAISGIPSNKSVAWLFNRQKGYQSIYIDLI